MASKKLDVNPVVWTQERILSDLKLALFVVAIGITVYFFVHTYLTPR